MKYDFSKQIESFQLKTDKEILDYLFDFWKIDGRPEEDGSFKVVASYQYEGKDKNGYDYGYFVDVRSLNGDILYYPFRLGKIKIYTPHKDSFTKEKLWQINVKLSTKLEYRWTNPFLLQLADRILGKPKNIFADRLEKEKLVRDIFQKRGATVDDAQQIAEALHILIDDTHTDNERFLFELLQNADDQPNNDEAVSVTFKTLTEHLLVLHNGSPFTEKDVLGISSIGNSRKKNDIEKTGYKGIGFKSVFSDTETVYIDSGDFSFAFDKNSPVYNKEPNMDLIPWQIKPIWEERYRLPKEIVLEKAYFDSRVGIALFVGEQKIENYNSIIPNALKDPRFLLFLRHVGFVCFESLDNKELIKKTAKAGIVSIENKDAETKWIVADYDLPIPPEIQMQIKNNSSIPQKLQNSSMTRISFAINYSAGRIEKVANSVLFTYLPTKVGAFSFPFLVNADFIVNSSREYIHDNNIWNEFVFDRMGEKTLEWIVSLSDKPNYLAALPTLLTEYISPLQEKYYQSYKSALKSLPFILNHKGTLSKQTEIVFDRTGLSTIVGADLFCKLLGLEKLLPSESINNTVFNGEIFADVESLEFDEVIVAVTNNTEFNRWFITLDDEQRERLYQWIFIQFDSDSSREDKLKMFVSNLPIFHFKTAEEEVDLSIQEIKANNSFYFNSLVFYPKEGLRFLYEEDYDAYIREIETREDQFREAYWGATLIRPFNYYIITSKVVKPVKTILNKINCRHPFSIEAELSSIGFLCSQNEINTDQILNSFLDSQNEEQLFEVIKQSDFTFLSYDERITLFFALKEFSNVGDAKLKEIVLFKNTNGDFRPLGGMVAYREGAPSLLYPYMICKDEFSEQLNKYLIDSNSEFEEIIWKHKDEFGISMVELFKVCPWSDEKYTRTLMNQYKGKPEYCQLLGIVESSGKITMEGYLTLLERLDLHHEQTYGKDSFEYRVLQMALSVLEKPSDFSSKIYFDGQCIKEFTVSDDVVCDFIQNGETKKVTISLAKLLPQYHNQSDSINKLKDCFESKKGLDKFFDAIPKPLIEVHRELNQLLGIPESYFSFWNVNGNAFQYLFATYYRRKKKGWYGSYVPKIDLSQETEKFVWELLDFLYDNKISVKESPFTYYLDSYFIGKYFDCYYILDTEQLLPAIEKWAKDDRKKQYLIDNGVNKAISDSVQFRQLFLEDKPIDKGVIDKLTDEELFSGITLFATADGIERPFCGNNQKLILLQLKDKKCCNLSDTWNQAKMNTDSIELDTPEYNNWVDDKKPRIFIYPGVLPSKLTYKDVILLNYEDTDHDYHYDDQHNKLFISNNGEIEDVLFEIVKKRKFGFDLDDYKCLCLEGKISVSEEDIAKKDQTIETLYESNRKKDEIIEQYRAKYGDIDADGSAGVTSSIDEEVPSIAVLHHNAQDEIDKQRGKVIERDGLSEEKQVAAHKEASEIIREKLEEDGYDCSNWIVDDDEGQDEIKKWHSVNQVDGIVSPEGDTINLVVKSAKGGYIYLSATDFEFLTSNSNNVLMVWDGDSVHSVSAEEIFNKDSNVNLIFDTEYTPKHYYAALSKVFQYVKRTTFAVKNPSYNAYNTIKSFGMDSTTEGVQELFDDNDL